MKSLTYFEHDDYRRDIDIMTLAEYIIDYNMSLRKAARECRIPYTTAHDMLQDLKYMDDDLWVQVKNRLKKRRFNRK